MKKEEEELNWKHLAVREKTFNKFRELKQLVHHRSDDSFLSKLLDIVEKNKKRREEKKEQ